MNLERVEEIASAVLYEGYMLYPYRPSAVKNRQRFNFGVLCPPSYCGSQSGSESSFMHTECLCRVTRDTRLTIRIRFLQIIERSVGRYTTSSPEQLEFVDRLEIDGRTYQSWQEAAERSVTYDGLVPGNLFDKRRMDFAIPAGESREELREHGHEIGAIIRRAQALAGTVIVQTRSCCHDIVKLMVRLENRSAFNLPGSDALRDAALPYSLVSAHLILGMENGEFLSLLDPPSPYDELARDCHNVGNWPVLAGDDATIMLASPIILYDHPQIAPESAGNLFDSTEIDEILSLRILTLTDHEKEEIRQADDRAREVLERTETMPGEQFMKLHGVLRGMTAIKDRPA